MDKKSNIIKILLVTGIILFLVSCVILGLNNKDIESWEFLILLIVTFIPLAASGFLYTSQIKEYNKKRFWLIRVIIFLYIVGIIFLLIKKCVLN